MAYLITNQALLDASWQAFVVEGRPQSILPGQKGVCAYRGPNGAKCAVGLGIPDELYSPGMENLGVDGLTIFTRITFESLSFARELQYLHDVVLPHPEAFQARLCQLAHNYNLKPPPSYQPGPRGADRQEPPMMLGQMYAGAPH